MRKNLSIKKSLKGKEYWRSLDQLAETKEFRDFLHREFPVGASEMNNGWSRRNFLTLMGASLALAGLASCRRPEEKIVPFVEAPENRVLGKPVYYATSMPFGVDAFNLLVESHEGRPTKIEGNSLNKNTDGSSNSFMQAEILSLYDPDRSQNVKYNGEDSNWNAFAGFWSGRISSFKDKKGKGLALLSSSFSSPTKAALKKDFQKKFPKAKWVTFDPVSDENIYAGAELAFGKSLKPIYDYSKARVVLCLDSDFVSGDSDSLATSKGFADGRRLKTENDRMNRLYVVEGNFTLTGGMADHRLRLKRSQIGTFLITLAQELKSSGLDLDALDKIEKVSAPSEEKNWSTWLALLAADLMANKGNSLLVAGRYQPAAVHALVFAINDTLGNLGKTLSFAEFKDASPSKTSALAELVSEMNNGSIDTLIIVDANPVYNAPADLKFAEAYKKVSNRITCSAYDDETATLSTWHIPLSHFLESWGDVRTSRGTAGIVQPLISPLFKSISDIEFFSFITYGSKATGYDLVRKSFGSIFSGGSFESKWRKVLHDGILENSVPKAARVKLKSKNIASALKSLDVSESEELEIQFNSSASLFDGRYANNGWLQELPDPVTKLAWDNACVMSLKTADSMNLRNKEIVNLSYNGTQLELPVWILPGHVDNSVSVELGYGRVNSGKIGSGVGFNTYNLRSSQAMDFGKGVRITKTGRNYLMANTQDHSSMEGRPIVREATLGEYKEHPNFAPEMVEHPPLKALWNEHKYESGNQWGMSIDLTTCTGCNACTIACQSENNIPVVGKEQVEKGREMHWIRIDRYFTGDTDDPEMVNQPVPCMQCEDAPCEQVCPVAATTHNEEGLNQMTYNRCIGTRYCANNCPYKVRRFNFFNFTKDTPEIVKMAKNPDVSIRFRGVMEKCTYCVQRINSAKMDAKLGDRELADGDIKTACQQACPVQAITFGNILDKESKVAIEKDKNRNYAMLSELMTKPRTTYLAKIRNPNLELASLLGKTSDNGHG